MGDRDHETDEETTRGDEIMEHVERRSLDPETLRRTHEDAKLTLRRNLETFTGLSEMAFRLVRMNALVVTIVVAAASQVRTGRYLNALTVAAVLLFVASVVLALVGYTNRRVDTGVGGPVFEKAVAYRLREDEYLEWVLTEGYARWIERAVEKSDRKERWVRYSLTAFLAGITSLTAGTVMSLY